MAPDMNAGAAQIFLQEDGKVLIHGSFTHVGNCYRKHLARLNIDGSLDEALSWTHRFSTSCRRQCHPTAN